MVKYKEKNIDSYDSTLSVIFHYENGNWDFIIPGFTGRDEDLAEYNFVDIK